MHHMFNVVTDIEGRADVVLVRAAEPLEGVDAMHRRRGDHPIEALARGRGVECCARGYHARARR